MHIPLLFLLTVIVLSFADFVVLWLCTIELNDDWNMLLDVIFKQVSALCVTSSATSVVRRLTTSINATSGKPNPFHSLLQALTRIVVHEYFVIYCSAHLTLSHTYSFKGNVSSFSSEEGGKYWPPSSTLIFHPCLENTRISSWSLIIFWTVSNFVTIGTKIESSDISNHDTRRLKKSGSFAWW